MTTHDKTQWIIGGPLGILLIHGLGGSPTELVLLARALGDAGHTVCSVQLAGHGTGAAALAASSATDWRESALAAHAVLRRRCDRVIVAGLSMGALLALDIARLRPQRVQGLILLAPALRLDGWAMPRSVRYVGRLPASLVPTGASVGERHPYGIKDERIRAIVLAGLGRRKANSAFLTPLRALIAFHTLADMVRPHLSAIRQPALIIHPREDDMASLSNAQEIASNLGGLTDMLILDDSYHLITLDRQRRLVQERVTAFAATIDATPRPDSSRRNSWSRPPRIPSSNQTCTAGRLHGDVL
jgi:carboxylesterase